MRNKSAIIFLTVLITILCIFYLSFTFVARKEQKKATAFATDSKGVVSSSKKQQYLDSIYDKTVYNFVGIKYTYKEVKETELALGLDLQGGMHLTLEVSPIEILTALAGSNSSDPSFKKAIQNAKEKQKNSQESFTSLFYSSYKDLEGSNKLKRIFSNNINRNKGIDSRSSDEQVEKVINAEVDGAVERAEEILRTRIDRFGAVQPNIQRLKNSGRIQVELPGVENPQRVRNLLQGAAKLEFLEVYHTFEIAPALTQINTYLLSIEKPSKEIVTSTPADKNAAEKLLAADSSAVAQDTTKNSVADSAAVAKSDSSKADSLNQKASSLFALLKAPNTLRYEVKDTAKINRIFENPKVKSMLPANLRFFWEKKPYVGTDGMQTLELVPVKKSRIGSNVLTGEVITDARGDVSQDGKTFEVSMQMNTAGAKKWKKMTAEASSDPKNKRRIAIVLDDYVYSAPSVNNEIPNGNSSITGDFSFEEAKDLANILKAGKLPAPVRIVEEVIVGPSLGKEAIAQGLYSMLGGLALVVFFMIAYYGKGGMVANIALLFNILFVLGIMASMGSVLTLPGIAGIVLTIGMSVDANVLIFERIKEELANGKSVLTAIDLGYDKAFSSIFDSNVTTILSGIILWVFGSGPVQGFALTLIIGIVCSFFTAVYISKVILLWMVKGKEATAGFFSTSLSKNQFTSFNFDIIGKRKIAYIFSGTLLVLGIISIIVQGGLNLGVDFKGGRSYVVQFSQPVVSSDIRESLADDFKSGPEVKTFGSSDKVKITTSYLINDESSEGDHKVEAALVKGLNDYNKGKYEIQSSTKVGATVADDIQNSSWQAIFYSLIGIFIYVLVRFRKWQFSLGGIVALFHDVLMVVGIFSILRLLGISYEVDQVLIAALLTIVGFSINDTVVVFDRVREFVEENPKMDLPTVLNKSINHTFSRTIITSLTVLLVVLILVIFGGETLRGFSVAMLIGVIFGSYSTIFIAVPIVLDLRSKDEKDGITPTTTVKKPQTV